jgi:8-oxo-dGTP pyrophosphatase MutT (NUDIX family)
MRLLVINRSVVKQYLARGLQRFPPLRWILLLMVKLLAPRNHVGVVGVVFDEGGRVLLAEHVFRTDFAWGLPGGWLERGEDPIQAIQREIEEELNLKVQVKKLLLCELQGGPGFLDPPLSLGLAFYCRLLEPSLPQLKQVHNDYEILAVEWADPYSIRRQLPPFQQKAIFLGRQAFELDSTQTAELFEDEFPGKSAQ